MRRSLPWAVVAAFLLATAVRAQEPLSLDEARESFERALALFNEKKYEEAIADFRKIFDAFPAVDPGPVSAYNIACAYSLMDKKNEALDWLGKAVEGGYRDVEHFKKDADLDNIRREERYLKIVRELESAAPIRTTEDCAIRLERNLKEYLEGLDAKEREPFESLRKKMESATVMLIARNDDTGTGAGGAVFVRTSKGKYVVTCGHNFSKGGKAVDPKIRLSDGRLFPVRILKMSKDPKRDYLPTHQTDDGLTPDLAICKVENFDPDDSQCVYLAKDVKSGERAFLLGYGGYYGRRSGGEIGDLGRAFSSGNATGKPTTNLIALTNIGKVGNVLKNHLAFVPIGKVRVPPVVGNSGGPLFNDRGELIGIVITSLQRTDMPDAGCVGLNAIRSALEEVESRQ